jgi:endonuclease/exonuclease/phosphatase (EEP) superfamily protein YafD
MMKRIASIFKRYAIALSWVYFTILFGWLALYLLSGDRFSYLGLMNNFAVSLFFPLPVMALIAIFTRRKELIGGTLLGAAVFVWFWGTLFIPRSNLPKGGNPHPALVVMTYNVLGMHGFIDPAIEVIRQENADLVFLQELTPELAETMQHELGDLYPYQILDPKPSVMGMGTLSRYPLADTGERLPLDWVGTPQILDLDFEGIAVTLVNFHTFAYHYFPPAAVNQNLRYRETQAVALADFAARTPGPLIIAGDANAADLTQPYRTIRDSGLQDAWRAAGFGLGSTFPGSTVPASSRWKVGPWYVPQWMVRIDYIFVSPHWEAHSARVAQFDGVSDHRGVVAELVLGK